MAAGHTRADPEWDTQLDNSVNIELPSRALDSMVDSATAHRRNSSQTRNPGTPFCRLTKYPRVLQPESDRAVLLSVITPSSDFLSRWRRALKLKGLGIRDLLDSF